LKDKGVPYTILTKSDLILRDIDILSESDCTVSITLTNCDDRVSKMTEPGAPLPSDRLRTVRELCDSGIDTVVLIAPVMSSLEGHEEELVRRIADTGVRRVTCDPLNVRNVDTTRLDRMGIGRSVKAMEGLLHHGRKHGLDISDDY
jgi:DNA repair photolyase